MPNYNKPPVTVADQIQLLKGRNLVISDEPRAEKYLTNVGYYRLTGYMFHLQKDKTHTFDGKTDFNDIINCYQFDKALRSILTEYIERLEVFLRTSLTDHYSLSTGSFFWYRDNNLYADQECYDVINREIDKSFKEVKELFLRKFRLNYDDAYPPSNMALETLTFGKLTRLYGGLKNEGAKQIIAKKFGLPNEILTSWLVYISNVRNICAHHARLWNRYMTADRFTVPKRKSIAFTGVLTDDFNTTMYGVIAVLNRLLDAFNPGNNFVTKVIALIKQYNVDTEYMHFHKDWEQNPPW